MNILTAAGIAQINEPILPQNGERIWGGLGVVTFNQASQYNEEENPNDPITPPDCVNCGGGIPPEVPPPEPQIVKQCNSDCSKNILWSRLSWGSRPFETFKLHSEAMSWVDAMYETQEHRDIYEARLQTEINAYPYTSGNYMYEFSSLDPINWRVGQIDVEPCYNITVYDDGSEKKELVSYAKSYYYSYYYQNKSAILNINVTNLTNGNSQIEYKYIPFAVIERYTTENCTCVDERYLC